VAKNEVEAVKWFRKAAEQNDPQAQHNLGYCYAHGLGVTQDFVEAVKCFRKAAEQNDAQAQCSLGTRYGKGQGVAKDEVEAVRWFRRAAEQNLAEAQYNLGARYAMGLGVTLDYAEAYKWLLLSGAQGDQVAKRDTARVEHQLTRQQLAEAQRRANDFKLLEVPSIDAQQGAPEGKPPADLLARAATGDAQAQNELGEALYAGKRGAGKSAVEAVRWFRQAAEQNLAPAQSNLGVCYERGDGVAKYEVEAYKWDLLAAAQGDTKAKHNASLLELLLSPEQIAEGSKQAQAWLEQRKQASTNNR
jgi:TPR repeat protein